MILLVIGCCIICHVPQPYIEISVLVVVAPSGREPSISSDTRTDSSTDSYSYKHSRTHHESMASHISSDSQGTVVCNQDSSGSQNSMDSAGNNMISLSCTVHTHTHTKCPHYPVLLNLMFCLFSDGRLIYSGHLFWFYSIPAVKYPIYLYIVI